MKRIIILIMLVLSVIALAENRKVFGFTVGMTIEDVKEKFGEDNVKKARKGIYTVDLNNINNMEYALIILHNNKICKVAIYGDSQFTNKYGDQLKTEYEEIHTILVKKYGNPEDHNFLKSGSYWDEPQDFIMALSKKERYLSSYWVLEDVSIALGVDILSAESFQLYIAYEFKEFYKYLEELKKIQNDMF